MVKSERWAAINAKQIANYKQRGFTEGTNWWILEKLLLRPEGVTMGEFGAARYIAQECTPCDPVTHQTNLGDVVRITQRKPKHDGAALPNRRYWFV
jgi:hypothetical protein